MHEGLLSEKDGSHFSEKVEKVYGLLPALKQLKEESQESLSKMNSLLCEVPVDLAGVYAIFADLPAVVERSYERISYIPKTVEIVSGLLETAHKFVEDTLNNNENVAQILEEFLQLLIKYIRNMEEIVDDLDGGIVLLHNILESVKEVQKTMDTNTN
ncbi:MAG: hypothetical protein LBL13_08945 [Bacteroidales bacterium]|jgi:ABC-type transporter Mla subunit MlaD|nr:hypothetical protein [Bacteroidales bacterium]